MAFDKRADNALFKKMWDNIFKDMSSPMQKDIKSFIKNAPDDQTRVEFFKEILDSCSFKYAEKYEQKDVKSAMRAFNKAIRFMVFKTEGLHKLHGAVKEFTKCISEIKVADKSQHKLLATALYHRASVLINLGDFENAITDLDHIERLYKNGLSSELELEYYYSRHVTLVFLRREKEAQKCYDTFEILAHQARVRVGCGTAYPYFSSDAGLQIYRNIKNECLFQDIGRIVLPHSYSPNSELPCASSCVKLAHNSKWGRHFIASRDIQAGEMVLVEEAIAFSINPYDTLGFCHFCFRPCHGPYPCNDCNQMRVLKSRYAQNLQSLMDNYTQELSNSKLLEVQSQLKNQQAINERLKEELAKLREGQQELEMLTMEKEHLESCVNSLSKQITELKRSQKPESEQLAALRVKLESLEQRHQIREVRLQAVVKEVLRHRSGNMQPVSAEIATLRGALRHKNEQLATFQAELGRLMTSLSTLKQFRDMAQLDEN